MSNLENNFFQPVIDSLPEQIAIIDRKGTILTTNRAWNRVSRNKTTSCINRGLPGDNYLDICSEAAEFDERMKYAVRNLKLILEKKSERFSFEYPSHNANRKRWYLMHVKPLIVEEKLEGAVITHINITKRKVVELKAKRLSSNDDMTGVLNRKTGIQYLQKEMKMSDRRQSNLSLCYVDIDNLKFINDNFGHKEGDEIIKKIVNIITDSLRETDLIARMGGDEFLIVLPDTSFNNSKVVMQRVMEKIDDFNGKKSKPYELSISFGFAEYDPVYKMTPDKLIETADTEMYRMKRSHKKNYPYFIIDQQSFNTH